MGIAGLWKLLLPIGRRISLETLAGKVLAIDASIWWIQLEQALRRREGNESSSAATFSLLIKLFLHRLCKLKFYNIRPVFVLDGKTPEMKLRTLRQRRKQQGGDESYERSERHLQRIAKQLLQKQILTSQKSVTTTTSTAAAEKKKSTSNKGNETSATSASFAPGFDPGAQQKKPPSHTDKSVSAVSTTQAVEQQDDEVVVLVDSEEEPGVAEQDSPNDWEDDDSSYKDATDNDLPSTLTAEQKTSLNEHIQSVWKLPSHERKAALENIQRQYRLQSRKEFMPAAAQPQHFSQVQLKHFLKSCQLRQAVVQQHAAHSDDRTRTGNNKKRKLLWGQPTAYDRSIRVELIRETDGVSSKVDHRTHSEDEKGGFLRPFDDAKRSANDNVSGVVRRKKSRVDNITSSDRAAASNTTVSTNHDMDEIARQEQLLQDEQLAEALQSVEYEQDEDGSVVDSEENAGDEYEADCFVWQNPHKNDSKETKPSACSVIEVNDDSEIEWEEGDVTKEASTLEGRPQSESNEEKQFTNSPIEVNDDSEIEWEEGDVTKEAIAQEDKPKSGLNEAKLLPNSPIEVNDESEIEWVEGRDEREEDAVVEEKARGRGGIELANNEGNSEHQREESEEDSDDEEVRIVNAPSVMEPVPEGIKHRDSMLTSSETQTEKNQQETNTRLIRKPEPAPLKNPNSFDADEFSPNASQNAFKNGYGDLSQSDAMNTEALERAQKTASNLANWAGRVFRRAMKEVHEASETSPVAKQEAARHEYKAVGSSPSKILEASREMPLKSITSQAVGEMITQAPFRQSETAAINASKSVQSNNRDLSRTLLDSLGGFDSSMLALNDAQIIEERMQRQQDENNGAGEMRDEMRETLLQLLRLFGVPYVEAPAEAEAQCVELERLGLVDGIVTEDSDAFVFGGSTVYKNMFDEMKYVEVYRASDAEKEMSLGRNEMIALAMLLGGDYTEGVRGVGIVNAMEVLDAFDMSKGPKQGLLDFHKWLISFSPLEDVSTQAAKKNEGNHLSRFEEFSRKHRSAKTRWETPGNFPSDRVITAYMSPVVDNSPEKFTWGTPDLENLIPFCAQHIGWSREETVKVLEPVTKQARSGYHQTRIDSFMKYEDSIKFAKVRSKRLRKVLGLEEQPNNAGNKEEMQLE